MVGRRGEAPLVPLQVARTKQGDGLAAPGHSLAESATDIPRLDSTDRL